MIPQIIHITDKCIDDHLWQVKCQWQLLNPEYRIILYGDEHCIRLLQHFFGQKYVDIFHYLKDGPIKCDFFRACVLFVCGGIYADADIKPIVPLSTFIDESIHFATCLSFDYRPNKPNYCYNPHFIACEKGAPELHSIIRKYEQMYDNQVPYDYWTWSICSLFEKIGDFPYESNAENTFSFEGRTFRFLSETIEASDGQRFTCFEVESFMQQINNKTIATPVQFHCDFRGRAVFLNFANKNTTPVACGNIASATAS
jgi:hypothetical protein